MRAYVRIHHVRDTRGQERQRADKEREGGVGRRGGKADEMRRHDDGGVTEK